MINMPGGPEIAVILLIALIVLGPQQLPKAMRSLGNAMAEIRKISNGFQAEMRSAMDAIETQGGETPAATGAPVDPAAEANVTEVVARNPAVAEEPPTLTSGTPAGTVEAPSEAGPTAPSTAGEGTTTVDGPDPSAPGRPVIDPADRAAG